MGVVARERELYEDVYDAVAKYGAESPGAANVPLFLEMAEIPEHARYRLSALDAGCGGGYGALALQKAGFGDVAMCDITDYGLCAEAKAAQIDFFQTPLWEPLGPAAGYLFGGKFDYTYCCDVLEHIPKEYTMLVISRLLEVTRTGLFLSISHKMDIHGLWVGKHLHQTVEQFTWWRDNLAALAEVAECRDLLNFGLFLLKPRG